MNFELATHALRDTLCSKRPGEIRIGERIGLPSAQDLGGALAGSPARFVLLGIPEDIGVRANLGVGGAHSAWLPALRAFLNTQSNAFVDGSEVLLLGQFRLDDLMHASESADLETLREMVAQLDALVDPVIEAIVRAGRIPIVIGGGHNNAYPLLKGASIATGAAVNSINLDAHSDFRRIEGRHSGNGFRYAKTDGYLGRYALPWLHEAYNSAAVVSDIDADPDISVRFAEHGASDLESAISLGITFVDGAPTGIELDLDCIRGVLSSAATPSGISAEQARAFVRQCATDCDCVYLHLTEGATQLRDGREDLLTAKLISYLIRDFIAARKGRGIAQ